MINNEYERKRGALYSSIMSSYHPLISFRLSLFFKEFEGKYKEKKIGKEMKEKMKKNNNLVKYAILFLFIISD